MLCKKRSSLVPGRRLILANSSLASTSVPIGCCCLMLTGARNTCSGIHCELPGLRERIKKVCLLTLPQLISLQLHWRNRYQHIYAMQEGKRNPPRMKLCLPCFLPVFSYAGGRKRSQKEDAKCIYNKLKEKKRGQFTREQDLPQMKKRK